MTLVGEDRLAFQTVKTGATPMLSYPVAVGMSSRLSAVGRAFQRVKWNRVSVSVVPQVSVTTNGGYVAGFVMDPSDDAVDAVQLTANQNSQTRKWFESCVCVMPRKPDLLYTSSGSDPRLSQPARFWVIGEGTPQNPVPLVLTVKWSVTFSEPTVEAYGDKSFVIEGDLVPKPGNYNLQLRPLGGAGTDDTSKAFPSLGEEDEAWYRVPTFIVEYSEGTGDTGTKQMHYIVYKKDKRAYYADTYGSLNTTPWQSGVAITVAVPDGTYCKYVGSGNVVKGVASPASPLSPSITLERCVELLTAELLSRNSRSRSSRRSPDSLIKDFIVLSAGSPTRPTEQE